MLYSFIFHEEYIIQILSKEKKSGVCQKYFIFEKCLNLLTKSKVANSGQSGLQKFAFRNQVLLSAEITSRALREITFVEDEIRNSVRSD